MYIMNLKAHIRGPCYALQSRIDLTRLKRVNKLIIQCFIHSENYLDNLLVKMFGTWKE